MSLSDYQRAQRRMTKHLDERDRPTTQSNPERTWSPIGVGSTDALPYSLLATLNDITFAVAREPVSEPLLKGIIDLVAARVPGLSLEIRLSADALPSIRAPITVRNQLQSDRMPTGGAEVRVPLHAQGQVVGSAILQTSEPTLRSDVLVFLRSLISVIETGIERTTAGVQAREVRDDRDTLLDLAERIGLARTLDDLLPVVEHLTQRLGLPALHVVIPGGDGTLFTALDAVDRTPVEPKDFCDRRVVRRALEDRETQLVIDVQRDAGAYIPLWNLAAQAAVTPLVDLDVALGVVVVETPAERALRREDVRASEAVASILAPAVRRIAGGMMRARHEFATSLIREMSGLARESDSEELFFHAVATTINTAMGWSCAVGLLEGERLRFPVVICAGDAQPASWLDEDVPISVGVTGRVARTGEAVLLTDATSDPDFLEATPQTTSEICIPLIVDSTIVGILNIESIAPDRLDEIDFDLAIGIARIIELGVQTRRLRALLATTSDKADALHDLVDAALMRDDPHTRLRRLLEEVCNHDGASQAAVWLVADNGLELLASSAGADAAPIVDYEDGALHQVLTKGQAHIDFGWIGTSPLIPDSQALRGICVAPIRLGENVQGVFVAAGQPGAPLSGFKLDMIEVAAGLAGIVSGEIFAEREVSRAAGLDPTTAVPNIEFARQRLDALLQRASDTGLGFAVLMLDLDDFREVNTALGRDAGDAILRRVADRLVEQLRGDDLIARYGSDEFVVVLPGAGERDATQVAQRLIESVADVGRLSGRPELSVSVGIAAHPDDGDTVRNLLRAAEAAVDAAKSAGSAQIAHYRDLSNFHRGDLVRRWYSGA